jgi:hypothetical protein
MLLLHAHLSDGSLTLWAESLERFLSNAHAPTAAPAATADHASTQSHPFATSAQDLSSALRALAIEAPHTTTVAPLRLPAARDRIQPSDRLAGLAAAVLELDDAALTTVHVPAIIIAPEHALQVLIALDGSAARDTIALSHDVEYWIAVAGFVLELLADQRVVPSLVSDSAGSLQAIWLPYIQDSDSKHKRELLLNCMPAVTRAAGAQAAFAETLAGGGASAGSGAEQILDDALAQLTDAAVRCALTAEDYIQALDERDHNDPHVAWLRGLLSTERAVAPPAGQNGQLLRNVRRWIDTLSEQVGAARYRLLLRVHEAEVDDRDSSAVESATWRVTFHLVRHDGSDIIIDAEELWTSAPMGLTPGIADHALGSASPEAPEHVLLTELARASRIFPRLEAALEEAAPSFMLLDTSEVYELLRDARPILEESGVTVEPPEWWDSPMSRLGLRLMLESAELAEFEASLGSYAGEMMADGADGSNASSGALGSTVRYRWEIASGEHTIRLDQLHEMLRRKVPLLRVRDRWIEVKPEHLRQAEKLLESDPGGRISLREALRLAFGVDEDKTGLPVLGVEATGWVGELLGGAGEKLAMRPVEQPEKFRGSLRPYQRLGVSWLWFLSKLGMGACLADDMGLGKTIQLIALLLIEREKSHIASASERSASPSLEGGGKGAGGASDHGVGATLLIVPTSVMSNWSREIERFAPSLRVHTHHGPSRLTGAEFVSASQEHDVIITTYALVGRDADLLAMVPWHRVVLDEAQFIKNSPTRKARVIRSLSAHHRVALTGTPVENRLTELWSIMDFCNPGYLGSARDFRTRFAIPIERRRDQQRMDKLRKLVRPFVLRRLKSDPRVIVDLPECLETREYATLSPMQARLYQAIVSSALLQVDQSQGMRRRGLVLAALSKLKQVCNHPDLVRTDDDSGVFAAEIMAPGIWKDENETGRVGATPQPLSQRSGKCRRLLAMLEEVLAEGDQALVFTQFRRMGNMLLAMIEHELDRPALFLHGGVPPSKRQAMIDQFQAADGSAPVFILSLKAGGLGLNLTAANHVFHFDRWWNPAVEQQATDRAYRIGQNRTVHVHKFVCMGTLEEGIDQMLEQKKELATSILGAGEQWITELSTDELRQLFALRQTALEEDG